MKRILRDVYGVDLLNPPEEARGAGTNSADCQPDEHGKRYSPEKWQDIRRAFGVTQVLTYPTGR